MGLQDVDIREMHQMTENSVFIINICGAADGNSVVSEWNGLRGVNSRVARDSVGAGGQIVVSGSKLVNCGVDTRLLPARTSCTRYESKG